MSNYWQKERNKTSMGDPSNKAKEKGKMSDPFFSGSPKASSGGSKMMKGMESSEPETFPDDGGAGKGFKWLDRSTPKKGSI